MCKHIHITSGETETTTKYVYGCYIQVLNIGAPVKFTPLKLHFYQSLIAASYRLSECNSINEQCWNLTLRVDGLVRISQLGGGVDTSLRSGIYTCVRYLFSAIFEQMDSLVFIVNALQSQGCK